MNTGIQDTLQNKPIYVCLDVLNTGIQDTVQRKPIFVFLDELNTGIQDTGQSKPVLDAEFHTELIIKDECEDIETGCLVKERNPLLY